MSAPSAGPQELDLRGLNCPLPVLKTRRRLSAMATGEELVVLTTDPLAVIDIPAFCREAGHILLETDATDGGHRFRLRKTA
ncbi:MAG TPA: sulfurtransferase TusA family protein [Rhizobiaceae bacterium]|nr:sulfurtransferase TusA family protein [Rhizobiaceae bacterium]